MKLLRKIRGLFRKRNFDTEMLEEMRLHLELQTEQNIACGMDPDEARYAALRQFGGVEQIKEQARDQRGWVWLEQTGNDFRYAIRVLLKSPGFTAAAVLTLALGIGVNAALFTVYEIVAVRSLPSREPEQLVEIRGRNEQVSGGIDSRFSYLDYLDYRAENRSFAEVVAVAAETVRLKDELSDQSSSQLETGAGVVTLQAVSDNYFSTLGGQIALGRDFRPEESAVLGGPQVIVISHLFWKQYLSSASDVLGRTIVAEDRHGTGRKRYTIVGVTTPEFVGQTAIPPAGWIPLTANPESLDDRSHHYVSLVGRLNPGVSRMQAWTDLTAIARRLVEQYPEERRATSVRVLNAMRIFDFPTTPKVLAAISPILLGFTLVLILACLNVANLLLARGITRQHEIGVRLALGAGRGRIVRQLFAENILLCFGGGAVGSLFSIWTLQVMRPIAMALLANQVEARNIVALLDIRLDARIVGFAAVLALVASVTSGLGPALHASKRNLFFALKSDGSIFGPRLSQSRLRNLLVIAQVAVCLTLLSVAGLMAGNLVKVQTRRLGFDPTGVFVARFEGKDVFAGGTMQGQDTWRWMETLRSIPGIQSVCVLDRPPLQKAGNNLSSVLVNTRELEGSSVSGELIDYNRISAGFFETFGVAILRGRTFSAHELQASAPVVVISESAARRFWPKLDAVGKTIAVSGSLFVAEANTGSNGAVNPSFRDCEVVGVSADIRSDWAAEKDEAVIYLPFSAATPGIFFVRLRADSAMALRSTTSLAAASGLPLQFRMRFTELIERGVIIYQLFAWLSGALAALSVALAVVGLYGVMSFTVNQRVREIGIRMALGATAPVVISHFVRQGLRLVFWGMTIGSAGSLVFLILVTKMLPRGAVAEDTMFRVTVLGTVGGLLVLISLFACWLPARRAAKVDPMVALRAE